MFANKGFRDDFPVNHNNSEVDWNAYRLSLPLMKSIRHSVAKPKQYLRATCNYPTEGLQYTDYARAKLSKLFTSWRTAKCPPYEYINIRGNHCSNCTAMTSQNEGKAWMVNSVKSSSFGCEFDGRQGAQSENEHNFGNYVDNSVNTNHRCSASPDSTTQHWFGAQYNF